MEGKAYGECQELDAFNFDPAAGPVRCGSSGAAMADRVGAEHAGRWRRFRTLAAFPLETLKSKCSARLGDDRHGPAICLVSGTNCRKTALVAEPMEKRGAPTPDGRGGPRPNGRGEDWAAKGAPSAMAIECVH